MRSGPVNSVKYVSGNKKFNKNSTFSASNLKFTLHGHYAFLFTRLQALVYPCKYWRILIANGPMNLLNIRETLFFLIL